MDTRVSVASICDYFLCIVKGEFLLVLPRFLPLHIYSLPRYAFINQHYRGERSAGLAVSWLFCPGLEPEVLKLVGRNVTILCAFG